MSSTNSGGFGRFTDPRIEQQEALTRRARRSEAADAGGVLDNHMQRVAGVEQNRLDLMATATTAARPARAPTTGRIAFNPETGEAIVGSTRLRATAGAMKELGEIDPATLPMLDPASLEPGFITVSPADFARRFENIDPEVDLATIPAAIWENLGYLADAAGAAVTATDMDGDGRGAFGLRGDWITNPSRGLTQEIRDEQSLEKQKGYMEGGLESLTGAGNALARFTETAIPAIGAGALTRSPQVVGTIVGAGMAGGMQRSDALERIRTELGNVDDSTLQATNADYAELRARGMGEDEARDVLAQQGSAVAGGVGAALAAPDYLLGLRLARQGLGTSSPWAQRLLGTGDRVDDAIARGLGRANLPTRLAGGMVVGGVAEGTQEVAETSFSQAAGSAVAGPGGGSANPMDYASWDDFQNAAPVGALLGGMGGLARGARAQQRTRDEVRNAVASADPALAAAAGAVQGGQPVNLPAQPAGTVADMFGGAPTAPRAAPAGTAAAGAAFDPSQQDMFPVGPEFIPSATPNPTGSDPFGGPGPAGPEFDTGFDVMGEAAAPTLDIPGLSPEVSSLLPSRLYAQEQGRSGGVDVYPLIQQFPLDAETIRNDLIAIEQFMDAGPQEPAVDAVLQETYLALLTQLRDAKGPQVAPRAPTETRFEGEAADLFGGMPRAPGEPGAPAAGAPAAPTTPEPAPAVGPRGQMIQQRARERAAANDPQGELRPTLALPSPQIRARERDAARQGEVADVEARAEELNAQLRAAEEVAEMRYGPNWRTDGRMRTQNNGRALRADIARLEGELSELATRAQTVVPVPTGGPRPAARPAGDTAQFPLDGGPRSPAPAEPAAAPAERAPTGDRPMGVAPAPTPNPEPMAPAEAASRAARQEERGQAAPAPAPGARLRRGAAAAAPAAPAAADPRETTSEPAGDIAAQFAAMLDPNNPKDTVWVTEADLGKVPGKLPKRVKSVQRATGTLFTISDAKFQMANKRRGNFTNAFIGKLLDTAVQSSDEVAARAEQGEPAAAVEAKDAEGNVVAGAVAAGPEAVAATAERAAAQTPPGGEVTVTDPREAQARRAELNEAQPAPRRADPPAVQRAAPAPAPVAPAPVTDFDDLMIYDAPALTVKEAEAEIEQQVQRVAPDQQDAAREYLWESWEREQPDVDAIASAADNALSELLMDSSRDTIEMVKDDLNSALGVLGPRVYRTVSAKAKQGITSVSAAELPSPQTRPRAKAPATKGEKLKRGKKAASDDERAPAARKRPAFDPEELREAGLDATEVERLATRMYNASRREARAIASSTWSFFDSTVRGIWAEITGIQPDAPTLRRVVAEWAKAEYDALLNLAALKEHTQKINDDYGVDPDMDAAAEPTPGAPVRAPITQAPGTTLPPPVGNVHYLPSVDKQFADVVNGWNELLGGKGIDMRLGAGAPDKVIIGTPAELIALYPGIPFNPNGVGEFTWRAVGGELVAFIAIDPARTRNRAHTMEVLAHEYGHLVERVMFRYLPQGEAVAVSKAFRQFLSVQASPIDAAIARALPITRKLLEDNAAKVAAETGYGDPAYAGSYHEWTADQIGRFLLTDAVPLGVVEKFFKSVADILRAVFGKLATGNQPADPVIVQTMRNMIARAQRNSPPLLPIGPASYNTLTAMNAQYRQKVLGPDRPGPVRATDAMVEIPGAEPGGMVEKIHARLGEFEGRYQLKEKGLGGLWASKAGQIARKFGYSLQTLRQLEERFRGAGSFGRAMTRWVDLQFRKAQLANKYLSEGNAAIDAAHNLSAKDRALLQKVMRLATYYKVHPDLAFDHKRNAHLTVKDEQITENNARRYREVRELWEALGKSGGEGQQVYAGLRDAIALNHTRTFDLTIGRLDAMIAAAEAEDTDQARASAEAFRDQRKLHERNRNDATKGPYFPLMRFGDFIRVAEMPLETVLAEGDQLFTTKGDADAEMKRLRAANPGADVYRAAVKADDGTVEGYEIKVTNRAVYFFESEAEANAATDEIMADIAEAWGAVGVSLKTLETQAPEMVLLRDTQLKDDYYNRDAGVPSKFLQEVNRYLAEGKLDPETHRTFADLALQSLPEMSFKHTSQRRKNVLGADEDMIRSYAHRLQSGAHTLAQLEVEPDVRKAWQEMESAASAKSKIPLDERAGDESLVTIRQAMNSLRAQQQRLADRMEYNGTNRVANLITDIASFFSLSFSLAYAAVNALQPTMVSMPVLAGMVGKNGKVLGATAAGRYLFEAYAGRKGGPSAPVFFTKRAWKDFADEAKSLMGKAAKSDGDPVKALLDEFAPEGTPERVMLQTLLDRGTLDFSFLNSLQDAMRGGKLEQKWATLQRMGMALPQQIEAMNRVVTALAAYRTGVEHMGLDPMADSEALIKFSDDVVARTQLDYSRGNRPEVFNRPIAGVLLQFKLYMQGMYMLMWRNGVAALRGATPEERKQGRATLAYFFGAHALVGGAAGVPPVAWPAMAMASLLFGDDDDEYKTSEQWARAMLVDLTGSEEAANVALRGLPSLLGLDIGDRIGIPMAIDTRYAGIREGDNAETVFDKVVLNVVGGAPYATFRRITGGTYDAAGALADGDPRMAVRELSGAAPAALRGIMRAAMQADEGLVDRDGDVFVARGDLSSFDLLQQALGLQSANVGRLYRERSDAYGVRQRLQQERQRVLAIYRNRGAAEGRQAIRDFNRTAPREFQIRAGDQLRSLRAAADAAAGQKPRDLRAAEDYLRD